MVCRQREGLNMTMTNDARADEVISHLRPWAWGGAVAVFLLPLVAMQFTDEVVWTTTDFVFWGVLLLSTAILIEITMRVTRNLTARLIVSGLILVAALLIWADAAVGVF